MTGNIFLDCIFLFLICYALVNIFYSISDFLLRRYCRYPNKSFLMLNLTHESKSLECDIRSAISKSLNNKCALLILCSELDLDEYMILWRLTDSYEHIIITNPDEFFDKLETVKSISVSL